MENDRTFLTEFIEVYKCYPALWRVKSDVYKNKHLTAKGIGALVRLCEEKKISTADVSSFVQKKINNMRAGCRREHKKVRESKSTGEIYEPKLWYYDRMAFIFEDESGMSNADDAPENIVGNFFFFWKYFFLFIRTVLTVLNVGGGRSNDLNMGLGHEADFDNWKHNLLIYYTSTSGGWLPNVHDRKTQKLLFYIIYFIKVYKYNYKL